MTFGVSVLPRLKFVAERFGYEAPVTLSLRPLPSPLLDVARYEPREPIWPRFCPDETFVEVSL